MYTPHQLGSCPNLGGLRSRGLRSLGVFLGVLFSVLALLSAGSRPARAATFQVTTLADSGAGSLRAAITSANGTAGSTVTFASGLTGKILLGSVLPALAANMTLTGPSASVLAVDGAALYTPFSVNSGVTAALSGLTIQNGGAGVTGFGGGFSNAGTVKLTGCTLTQNKVFYSGGGLANFGTATLIGCTLTQNSTGQYSSGGGGVYNASGATLTLTGCTLTQNSTFPYIDNNGGGVLNSGALMLTGCTLTGNSARFGAGVSSSGTATLMGCTLASNSAQYGGAIYNGGTLALTGCTLAGNSAFVAVRGFGYGGGVENAGTATLTGCTLAGNTAQDDGGGVFNVSSAILTLTDDILYGDSAPGNTEVRGSATASHCDIQGLSATRDSNRNFGADPRLSPLGHHGGPTQTFALLPGSPCLGAGAVSSSNADQRGVAVPQNGRYDIGAFESQGFTVTVTGGNPQRAPVSMAFAQSLTATVTANANFEPVAGGVVTFAGPSSGASAALAVSPAPIGIDLAVSVTATANDTPGGPYTVTADTGAGSATYSLTNTPVTATVPAVTTNPANQAVTAGQTGTFTAAASGEPRPTVQWQVSTNGGSTFANISGATSRALTLTSVTTTQNGNQYRAVFTNSLGTATSTAATLTVNTVPVVTTNPVSQTVTAGQTATFTAAASGNPTPTVQWQVGIIGINGGTSFFDTGVTSVTYSTRPRTYQSGWKFRAVFTNAVGSATTTAATLTVNKADTATTVSSSLNPSVFGQSVTFTASITTALSLTSPVTFTVDGAAGSPVALSGSGTTATFTTSALAPGAHTVVAAYGGDANNAASTSSTLTQMVTAATAPAVTTNPGSQTVTAGQTGTFTAAASGEPTPTVQWQVSTNGGSTFANISGATSTALTLTSVTTTQNGNQYRAVFTNSLGTATSTAATLTVNAASVVLSSVTFLTPVPCGTVLSGTVTLSGITPTDVVVGLSSSNSATIRLHRAVIVLAGSSSATFEIDTYRSHVTKTVTITAVLAPVTVTRDLTISGR